MTDLATSKNERQKEYLGDSVYVAFDGWHVVLTTENGTSISNAIYLEPEVLAAFNGWIERHGKVKP